MTDRGSTEQIVRFSRWARFQHLALIVLFSILLLTGLPQKWPYAEGSRWIVTELGGIFLVRWVHRTAGILFATLIVAHMATAIRGLITGRAQPAMLFTPKDFTDAIDDLRYSLGQADAPPKFGRYDYRQKFAYWALLFGASVMIMSGFTLYFPIQFTSVFPAEFIPVAKLLHSNQALLAFLIILVWHMYGAHLNPDVFPFDSSIFTGRIGKERLKREHRLEYEQLFKEP
jgi:formate dehydrogenase gamma subunit